MIEWRATETFHCAACGAVNAAYTKGFSVADVEDALSQVGAQCGKC